MIAMHVSRLPGTVMMHRTLLIATVDHEMYRGISSSWQPSENGISVSKFTIKIILQNTNTDFLEVNSACLTTFNNVTGVAKLSTALRYYCGKLYC